MFIDTSDSTVRYAREHKGDTFLRLMIFNRGFATILLLFLFTFALTLRAQSSANPIDNWIRLLSTGKDFSVTVPSNGYLTQNGGEKSQVWYFEKGVSLIVSMEKRGDAKSVLKRWASDKYLIADCEKYKYFESGDFLIRQYTYSDDPDENRLFLYLASSKGLYYVSASAKANGGPLFEKFASSIQLNSKPLFKGSQPGGGEPVVSIGSLKTDPIVLQALSRPDSRTSKLEAAPSTALPPTDNRDFSRGLITLLVPKAEYSSLGRKRMTNGAVKLRIEFLASGEIGKITLLSSLTRDLDQKAFEAARKIKFIPAEIDGKPVDSWRTLQYTFTIF